MLTYLLDISLSLASGNKSMPIGLVVVMTVAAMEDPQCAVVAEVSFWRLGGRSSRCRAAALASMSVVGRGIGDRSDPQVSFLAFSCLHYFAPYLNMRYTTNILALEIWLGQ